MILDKVIRYLYNNYNLINCTGDFKDTSKNYYVEFYTDKVDDDYLQDMINSLSDEFKNYKFRLGELYSIYAPEKKSCCIKITRKK